MRPTFAPVLLGFQGRRRQARPPPPSRAFVGTPSTSDSGARPCNYLRKGTADLDVRAPACPAGGTSGEGGRSTDVMDDAASTGNSVGVALFAALLFTGATDRTTFAGPGSIDSVRHPGRASQRR
jgi:hypothetical protein